MGSHAPFGSSSSRTGQSRGCPSRARVSSISLARCIRPRSSLDRRDQSQSTAGEFASTSHVPFLLLLCQRERERESVWCCVVLCACGVCVCAYMHVCVCIRVTVSLRYINLWVCACVLLYLWGTLICTGFMGKLLFSQICRSLWYFKVFPNSVQFSFTA